MTGKLLTMGVSLTRLRTLQKYYVIASTMFFMYLSWIPMVLCSTSSEYSYNFRKTERDHSKPKSFRSLEIRRLTRPETPVFPLSRLTLFYSADPAIVNAIQKAFKRTKNVSRKVDPQFKHTPQLPRCSKFQCLVFSDTGDELKTFHSCFLQMKIRQ